MNFFLCPLDRACSFYLLAALIVAAPAHSTTLYAFRDGIDGGYPQSQLIQDAAGNLFGTTRNGGSCQANPYGCGTVFLVSLKGHERGLYSFAGGCDGAYPYAGLVSDKAGNYYGTTAAGGNCNSSGSGTVFKLDANGRETVLYAFTGGSDGSGPVGDLVRDDQGNLYGTTLTGGHTGGNCGDEGCGTVFEIAKNGRKRNLYAFNGGSDAREPSGGLVFDKQGNLYGTTEIGGSGPCEFGCGTVFKITPNGGETVLYAFGVGNDGSDPVGDLILDNSGNLYGTTTVGGNANAGTIFQLGADGKETILHSFTEGTDGENPWAGLTMDQQGNLYGTTEHGGTRCRGVGCGTVFKITSNDNYSVLFAFFGKKGTHPLAGLILGKNGMLYGTALAGGKYKSGVVFKVKE